MISYEDKVLMKFIGGNIIENETELSILNEYRNIGWVKMGIRTQKTNDVVKIIPTACLTYFGEQFVKMRNKTPVFILIKEYFKKFKRRILL